MEKTTFAENSQKTSIKSQHSAINSTALMDYILKHTEKFNPTLRSITVIEKMIYLNKEFDSKSQLFKKLPKSMQYPIFNFILDVLEKSNKIMIDDKGSIFWTGQANIKLHTNLEKATKY